MKIRNPKGPDEAEKAATLVNNVPARIDVRTAIRIVNVINAFITRPEVIAKLALPDFLDPHTMDIHAGLALANTDIVQADIRRFRFACVNRAGADTIAKDGQ